jgi:hypothetical protein
MPTFNELVSFVKWHNDGYRKAKGRKSLQKGTEETEQKVKEMVKLFNEGLAQLNEVDQQALRLSLAGAMRDTLTTYLSFMRTERGIRFPDWH